MAQKDESPKIKALQDEIEFLRRHTQDVFAAGVTEGRKQKAAELRALIDEGLGE